MPEMQSARARGARVRTEFLVRLRIAGVSGRLAGLCWVAFGMTGCLLNLRAQGPRPALRHAAQGRVGERAGAASLSPRDRLRLERALAAFDAGRLQEAQPALVALANQYPMEAEAQAAAGMVLLEEGAVAEGVPYLERAHRLEPQNAGVAANLGIAALKLQRFPMAATLLREACRLQPQNQASRVALAAALVGERQFAAAATVYREADRMSGLADRGETVGASGMDLRLDWAAALVSAGRPAEAVALLQGTPGVAGSAPAQALLAEQEEQVGHFQEALAHVKRAADLEPTEPNLIAYGNELLRHWTFPAAVEVFRYAVGQYPESVALRLRLGAAYFGNNDFPHAAEVFSGLLARDPESAEAADLLGRSCSALSTGAGAGCEALQSFARTHPKNASASLFAAILLLQRPGDAPYEQAEALLRASLAADNKRPETWYQLAVLQQNRGDWAGSTASLERAIALRPEYAEAHYRLSRAYAHNGRRMEAQQQIALQQQFAQAAKDADNRRMREVMTFLTTAN